MVKLKSHNNLLPNDKFCFVCGNENLKGLHQRFYLMDDFVVSEFNGNKHFMGHNSIHGGVIASLLDEVMGLAASRCVDTLCITAEITIRYLKPLVQDEDYFVRGKVVADKRLLLETAGEILEGNTTLVRAQGKYVPLPQTLAQEKYPHVFGRNSSEIRND